MTAIFDPLLVPAPSPVRRATATPRRPARVSAAVYRRRRRVVGMLLASVAGLIAFVAVGSGAFATESTPARESATRTVVAQPGDTLWDIARTLAPRGAIGDLVSELVRLNGARIEAGQVIRLP